MKRGDKKSETSNRHKTKNGDSNKRDHHKEANQVVRRLEWLLFARVLCRPKAHGKDEGGFHRAPSANAFTSVSFCLVLQNLHILGEIKIQPKNLDIFASVQGCDVCRSDKRHFPRAQGEPGRTLDRPRSPPQWGRRLYPVVYRPLWGRKDDGGVRGRKVADTGFIFMAF